MQSQPLMQQSRSWKILIAEDDRFLRRAAEAMFRQHGYIVVTAADGEEALCLARAEKPDLIRLDLIMPKVQGFEVLKELRADPSTSPVPVVVMTNLGQESDRQEAAEAGAADYVVKANLDLEDLAKRVEQMLAGFES